MASNLAYRLSRPQQLAETANDISQYVFGHIKHPENEQYAAAVDENLTIPIHQFIKDSVASGNGVSVYFDNFYSTAEEATAKKELVVNSTGQIKVIDILPNEWSSTPHFLLEAEGWFASPGIE